MKPWDAHFCTECEEIFTIKKEIRCPSCMGTSLLPLTVFIKSTSGERERHEWKKNQITINPINTSYPPERSVIRSIKKALGGILCKQSVWEESIPDPINH